MELLNEDIIKEYYVGNENVFTLGKQNYMNGSIQLEFVGKYLVKSKISESPSHRAMIELNVNGGLKKTLCTCKEYQFILPCQHIVSTAFELIDYIKDHSNNSLTNASSAPASSIPSLQRTVGYQILLKEYSFSKSNEVRDLLVEMNNTIAIETQVEEAVNNNNSSNLVEKDENNNLTPSAPAVNQSDLVVTL
ncbi:hypothetical protein CYY_001583 [Polysphondylium violaceum]|uniref:SWIM-type domain-containing protein n=1 Tax=Polysphondylium violaceum TaxID=133409 RepID=A0A8J4PZY1_9MYCE|nr:hypothetical protein CYY_001583 [Polysphondylium violaceum]